MWMGTLSFGLVSVPVKLYSAVTRRTVHFHQIHSLDCGRIQQRHVCSLDGEEIPLSEIVRGYEIAPDRYVPVEPREPAPAMPDTDSPTPPNALPAIDVCPICQNGVQVADLPEIAAWSCGHWLRRTPLPIAESFQDMLRTAFQAGVAAAASGDAFETWYQREVLR